jgi:hypothetical protein
MINVGGCWRPKVSRRQTRFVNIRTNPSQNLSYGARAVRRAPPLMPSHVSPFETFGSVLHFLPVSAASAAMALPTHTTQQAPPNAPNTHKKLDHIRTYHVKSSPFLHKSRPPVSFGMSDCRQAVQLDQQHRVSKPWMMERVADGTSRRR